MLEIALKSMALLAAAWVTATLLQRRTAAARHLVWTAVAAALIALPLLSISLPALRLPVSGLFPAPDSVLWTFTADAVEAGRTAPASQIQWPGAQSSPPRRLDWRQLLVLAWAIGSAAGFARMLAAGVAIKRLRREARRLTDPGIGALKESLGIRREVEVFETRGETVPMTFGLIRPAVFLPAGASEWSEERRRMVLLHELAHVRRYDVAAHLLARIAASLYWWNPLAWVALRGSLKERERATDDLVIGVGERASDYAGHLLAIARGLHSPLAAGLAVGIARPSQLEGRLKAILDSRVNRRPLGRASLPAAALLTAVIVVPLAAFQAQTNAPQPALASGSGMVLTKIGHQALLRDDPNGAEPIFSKALSVLDNKADAVEPLTGLGMIAMIRKDVDRAADYFQRAQLADPVRAGQATMWLAIARDNQGRKEEAESLYKAAMAIEDPHSANAATVMELYAAFLRRDQRSDEADLLRDRAIQVRKEEGSRTMAGQKSGESGIHRIGGGVSAPVLIHKEEPQYSAQARAAKYEGKAVLYVEIDPDGIARNVRILQGVGFGLNEKAMEAISQWRFKPGRKSGEPVTVAATIEVNWRLL